MFIVPRASVCHAAQLGKPSGFCCIRFKMDDLFSTMADRIKEQAVTEFFMHGNGTPIKIHR
jgi:hypothetical protein